MIPVLITIVTICAIICLAQTWAMCKASSGRIPEEEEED